MSTELQARAESPQRGRQAAGPVRCGRTDVRARLPRRPRARRRRRSTGVSLRGARRARCSPSSARAAAARPRCWSSSAACSAPDGGSRQRAAGGADAPARPAAAVADALDNAALALRIAGRRAQRRARERAQRAVRRARARGLRGRPPATSSPAACASAWRSCARCSRASRAVPRRAVRRARRDHPRGDAGVAGGRARARAAHGAARDPRRRGGGRCSPTACSCSRRGPGGCVGASSRSPRPRPRERTDAGVSRAARAGAARARGRELRAALERRGEDASGPRVAPRAARCCSRRAARRCGSSTCDLAGVEREPCCPRRTKSPRALWHGGGGAVAQLRGHRRGGRARPRAGARRRASRSRSRSTSRPLLRRAVYPLAVGSQAVPIPVIGVLLVFWWGFGIFPKLVVIALICFFPVLVTTVDGLASVDPDQLQADAHARRLALAGVPLRRAAGRAARRAQRRADRARGGRDRRVHRRDRHAHHAAPTRASAARS